MAIKKVVATYDFSDETYKKFYEKEPGLILFHMDAINRLKFDQHLFRQLQTQGVEVDMLRHRESADIQSTVNELEKKLTSADLIFHETPRIAFEKDNSTWRKKYTKAIEELVHSKFLGKTHFASNDIKYSEKQEAARIARVAGIPIPKAWTVDEYFASNRPLPVIIKANVSSCGHNIYFIDKHEQIDKFFDLNLYDTNRMCTPNREDYEVQEFIETPSKHFTHYRVFAMGDGRILGAALSVSGNRKEELERVAEPGPFGPGSNIYNYVDSPIYMDCLKVVSNHAQGGSQIPFDANRDSKQLSENDKQVLIAHGYNPINVTLNPKLKQLVRDTSNLFSKYGVLYSGQDWMQDRQGNFFFIELNAGPGMEIFNTLYNRGEGDDETAMAIGIKKLAEAIRAYKM